MGIIEKINNFEISNDSQLENVKTECVYDFKTLSTKMIENCIGN